MLCHVVARQNGRCAVQVVAVTKQKSHAHYTVLVVNNDNCFNPHKIWEDVEDEVEKGVQK